MQKFTLYMLLHVVHERISYINCILVILEISTRNLQDSWVKWWKRSRWKMTKMKKMMTKKMMKKIGDAKKIIDIIYEVKCQGWLELKEECGIICVIWKKVSRSSRGVTGLELEILELATIFMTSSSISQDLLSSFFMHFLHFSSFVVFCGCHGFFWRLGKILWSQKKCKWSQRQKEVVRKMTTL